MRRSRRSLFSILLSTLVLLASPRAVDAQTSDAGWGPIEIARERVAPGEKRKFTFLGERSFEGSFIDFVVFVARGTKPGPTLCVTSAIHGDEVNSVEIARRSFAGVDATRLVGTLVVLPAVNSMGFRTMNRYLPDRRDLNRFFPGGEHGSVAEILADAVFSGVIRKCSHLIDLHTGSNLRTNMPQIRVDTTHPVATAMAENFGVGVIIDGAGPAGSLRSEAMKVGIPAIIYEAGPPLIFVEREIEEGVRGVRNVLIHLGMIESREKRARSKRIARSTWLRVPRGEAGIFLPLVHVGDRVKAGQLLATVTDPVTDAVFRIAAGESGIVIGMALPQTVLSGYGIFHVGELAAP